MFNNQCSMFKDEVGGAEGVRRKAEEGTAKGAKNRKGAQRKDPLCASLRVLCVLCG